jgi:hypothetical protein
VVPGVQNRLGTKAAHTENEDDVLEGFHDGLNQANVAVIVPFRNVTACVANGYQ